MVSVCLTAFFLCPSEPVGATLPVLRLMNRFVIAHLSRGHSSPFEV
ncbi:hypothetical protein HMPREF3226_02817 [Prevotella corporis]|uniref:Uncharacterized protein n=1 Tax=Prevotella corporis TaxID=28128 RepID=A0A133PSX9_9BACT|nr:hypothetical protein HMPREF3226_02817 [Prevotella corporis]